MNDGGLPPRTLHLDGLVGGQGRVFESVGVEAGGVLHTVVEVGKEAEVSGSESR